MKFIVLVAILLFIASSSWFWHLKGVEDQKKKTEACLNQSAQDIKQVRVGLDNQLNQQELTKVNEKFQECIAS